MTHQLTKRVEPACSAPQTQETGGEAANKGGKSGGQSEKSKCTLETDSRLTPAGTAISTPLTPAPVRSARALPAAPQQRPVGLLPFQGKFLFVLFTSF